MEITPIAHIRTEFSDKFGIPRQGSLISFGEAKIIFEKEYRNDDCIRSITDFSHLWLIWHFSESERKNISMTVRPPRLGGNTRVGVFASRSPYRPNPLGLTCVELLRVEKDEKLGNILVVRGADILDGTPIFDIKPYLPFADSFPDAKYGFAKKAQDEEYSVEIPENIVSENDEKFISALKEILSQNIRPAYHDDPERIYGARLFGREVKFTVCEKNVKVKAVI